MSAQAADIGALKEAGAGTNGFRPLVAADRTAAPLLAPASHEGQARIKQFKLLPGMKVDLWAAEPMLANPVAFSVDELGRVWTSETYRYRSSVLDIRHYMFMLEDDLASRSLDDRLKQIRKWFGPDGEQELSRETEVIRLLEDTDHDGKADKSTLVADGLNSPLDGIASGILARHGQVWFTDIPSVWKFAPSLQSKADTASTEHLKLNTSSSLASTPRVHLTNYTAEALLTGWGIRFSFTGHDLHGLKFGPDGRLYFSCGDRGTHVVTKEGNVIDLPDEGAVFRCELDGSQLEVFAHGLRNPQELAFDEYGNLFTGDNDSDQGDRERWEYVVEGGDYGWRVGYQHAPLGNAGPWNMERLWVPHFEGQAAYIIPPIANIGDGPSGLVYNYGTGLPASFDHRFLLADFKGTSAKSGIYSLLNRPAGAGFELVGHDPFIWNTLVPDVDIGPDGAVWFADWHEGWPKSNKGRLYRAYFPEALADPVVKETAKLLAEGMEKRPEPELLALLAHRDMRVRQEAQFELAARTIADTAQLARFSSKLEKLSKAARTHSNQLARIHALWAIGQVARLGLSTNTHDSLASSLNDCLPLLNDGDAEIRAQAIKVFGEAGFANARLHVAALLGDQSRRVRYFATLAYAKGISPFVPSRIVQRRSEIRAALALDDGQKPSPKWDLAIGKLVKSLGENAVSDELGGFKFQAAEAIGDAMAKEIYAHADNDVLLRHAASLEMANGPAVVLPLIHEKSRSLRLVNILAFRLHKQPNREIRITNFLSDPDPLLVLEAARAINDVPITNALPALAALADPAPLDALLRQFAALKLETRNSKLETSVIRDVRADQPLPWGDAPIDQLTPMLLRVVNANFRVGTPATAPRLAALATRTDLSDLIRSEALHALATWAKPHPRDRIVGVFRPLLERDAAPAREALAKVLPSLLPQRSAGVSPAAANNAAGTAALPYPPEPILIATTEAIAQLGLAGAAPQLSSLVTDTAAPAAARAAALRAFAQIENRKSETENLLTLAAKDAAEPLRLAASKLNAELNPGNAAGQLVAKLAAGSLAEQQSAFDSLGDLKSDAADAILADQLDRLMRREVANEVMLDLVEAAGKRSAAAVQSRLAAYNQWKLPQDHLTPFRETLAGGDAARGKKIFYENAAVACTRCHQIGSDGGGNAGPPMAGVASRQPREYLLESIVFPNQQIVPGFETATVTLKNGTAYAGVVKSETDVNLVILSPEDGDVTLKKADIATREKGLSGMPEGFGQLLSKRELRDLVEFIGTLK